jgi:hypothetical protein
MISFVLGVEDLADTRFALSPLHETLFSLRVLQDPGLSALHLPWRRSVLGELGALDTDLLMSLVAQRRTIPDFLTPNPTSFAPVFKEELAVVRQACPARVRRDLMLAHAPDPLPAALRDAVADDPRVAGLRDAVCEVLRQYWEAAIEPMWPQMRLVLEADMTYRARQLALGGARLLFADMHPNLRWQGGELYIAKMISKHRVMASGRGLLLLPSVFAHKPAPPRQSGRAAQPRLSLPGSSHAVGDGSTPRWSRTDVSAGRTTSKTAQSPRRAAAHGRTRPPPQGHPQCRLPAPARAARDGACHPGSRRTAGPVPPKLPR